MVELCVIGYLMGTCVAYFVVVGDLGPQIIAKLFDLNQTSTLRCNPHFNSFKLIFNSFLFVELGL